MNGSTMWVVLASTAVFVGILVWKALWLVRKINAVPAEEEAE